MTGFLKNILLPGLRPALTRWLPASALVVLCLATDSYALSQTRQDIENLQKNIFILQSEISDLKAEMRKLPSAEDVKQIRQAQADMMAQIQQLLRDMQVLTGRYEESKYFLERSMKETSADIDAMKAKVNASSGITKEDMQGIVKRIEALEAGITAMNRKIEGMESAGAKQPDAAKPAEKKETPDGLYDAALEEFKNNRFAKTREMMESLIKKYPDNSLAGNAQFWIAETYYSEKAYADAILAYEDLLTDYKGHNKIPAALLKQAFAFIELGDQKAARGILKELIEKYPDSEQAKTAKDKLAGLEGGSPKKPSEPQGPPAKPQ